ncbi:polyphosphate polymerase domain-containing protein [Pisciglobus halotolerans]|uniref:VTC domain-containing protein n=1 Tax=Pisciglobus halotolerans TaxID=745365 RepID=A0A1I3B9V4_9LACT|nr:polyphosphate polymerase domain-containing protein [Pisciglobus halotolerans]SFH58491.1 VTC domain-containing protein [Pisciglobus halotolerans]
MVENNLTVFRTELKYLIDLPDRLHLINCLDRLLVPDAYGGYDGYQVRSVYFDSFGNQDYIEKMEKFAFVKRVRLRVYDIHSDIAKFEIKRKKSGRQIKDSLIVTREEANQMLQGNFEVLKNYEGITAELGYDICTTMGYRPVSMVEYKRRVYTHPFFSTRITLDSDLKYCNFDYDLFEENPNYKKVMPLTDTILEVKYARYLFPQLQEVLEHCDLKKCPVSKFASSRELLEAYYY